MSIHGTCYDNGQSGNCNEECEVFKDGDCECHDDVMNGNTPTGTPDSDHLTWVYERLNNVHGDSMSLDFMLRLKKIILKLRSQEHDRTEKERRVHKPEHRKTFLRR